MEILVMSKVTTEITQRGDGGEEICTRHVFDYFAR
jgi:hypothetical protein